MLYFQGFSLTLALITKHAQLHPQTNLFFTPRTGTGNWQAQQKQYISFYYVSMHDAVG